MPGLLGSARKGSSSLPMEYAQEMDQDSFSDNQGLETKSFSLQESKSGNSFPPAITAANASGQGCLRQQRSGRPHVPKCLPVSMTFLIFLPSHCSKACHELASGILPSLKEKKKGENDTSGYKTSAARHSWEIFPTYFSQHADGEWGWRNI